MSRITDNDKIFRKIFNIVYGDVRYCFTCRQIRDDLEMGHYVPRTSTGVRWSLDNVRFQCVMCNRMEKGRPEDFRDYLIIEIGYSGVKKLESFRNKPMGSEFIRSEERRMKKELENLKKMYA